MALVLSLPMALGACGVNKIPTLEANAKTKFADLQADYQRRADLIPNLVATVKGYAAQEKSVLVEVTQARASATQIHVDPQTTTTDPAAMQKYAAAQNSLGGALSRPGRQRALSRPEVQRELPGPAKPARRHREPHHHRPARL
jgi:LemA protein